MKKEELERQASMLSDSFSAYDLAKQLVEAREKLKEPKSLEDLASSFGIPLTQETEEGNGVLFSIMFGPEGIQANYMVPGEVHEINVEGKVH